MSDQTEAIRAVLGSSMAAMQALDAYLAGAQAPLHQPDLPMSDVAVMQSEAKRLRAAGLTYAEIGKRLGGHSSGTIHRMVNGVTYKEIPLKREKIKTIARTWVKKRISLRLPPGVMAKIDEASKRQDIAICDVVSEVLRRHFDNAT